MAPILLLKVGGKDAPIINVIGDYEMWFQRVVPNEVLGVVDLRDDQPLWPKEFAGVIIMGSPHSVYADLPWLPSALDAVAKLLEKDIPVLGVCFGHQMICTVRGGQVTKSNRGYEVGTVTLQATAEGLADPLFGPLFRDEEMLVNESHGDSVSVLPDDTIILAKNDHDGFQALRHSEKVWSVQFHPEIGLAEAKAVMEDYRPSLESKGLNVDNLLESAQETPDARSVIQHFVSYVRGNFHG
ncbi:MAG: gamma-glutamyl-gamma-aminobutyrate hydrolase family protein [Planctomycetota bacterium]|nr:gamma-glutamyl-gamma-aminobutyrate hydrolase family protein [Planctomycetota bacterium]